VTRTALRIALVVAVLLGLAHPAGAITAHAAHLRNHGKVWRPKAPQINAIRPVGPISA
jgi:hypothetical protein